MADPERLSRIRYLPASQTGTGPIGSFPIDPRIPLPVEMSGGQEPGPDEKPSWEAVAAAALVVLAWQPSNPHASYYRQLILAVKPDIREELTHLGILQARNGDHDTAIEVFRSMEGLFPDSAAASMNLALALDGKSRSLEMSARTGQAEEYQEMAFEAYKRALAADPSEPTIHYNAAFFYLHHRTFDKAREHLDFYATHGEDPAKMREAARIVREIDAQGLVDGIFQKAYDLVRMGREEEGIAAARRFLEVHPDVPNAWFLVGWGLRRLARYAEGRDAFLRSLAVGAPHPDLLNELAICLMELGDLTESEKRLREALRLEPENTKIISNLGIVALKRGRTEEARGFFRTVLEIDPEDPIAPRYLAAADAPAAPGAPDAGATEPSPPPPDPRKK
jgi:Flp pilus assembly protein TadD